MSKSPEHTPDTTLCAEDCRILDLLAAGGFDPGVVTTLPAADRARAECLLRTFRLLEDYPLEDAPGNADNRFTPSTANADDALVDATLARIALHERTLRDTVRLSPSESASPWRPRFADLLTLAAVVLLGFGTIVPMANRVRASSLDAACASNLRLVGSGLAAYANDNAGLLPMVRAGVPSWESARNHDNLEVLPGGEYCAHDHLNCPGHGGGGASYSYRVIGTPRSARLDLEPSLAVVADCNPLIEHFLRGGRVVDLAMPSPNHGGRGQQVLFANLTVVFETTPQVRDRNGNLDNMWLIRDRTGREDLQRGALPEDPLDAFLSQ